MKQQSQPEKYITYGFGKIQIEPREYLEANYKYKNAQTVRELMRCIMHEEHVIYLAQQRITRLKKLLEEVKVLK